MKVQRTIGWSMLAACGAAAAGTITVNSDSGTHNYAALCVLRDAITTANTGTPTGACTISEPPPPTIPDGPDCLCTANTIVLPAAATIVLTEVDDAAENTGLPSIAQSLTISGNGSTIERSEALGCNRDGIADPGEFALLYNSSSLLVLDHVTLRNGCADSADYAFAKGGAVSNNGALVLQNVVLANNWASNRGGALYDAGYGSGAGYVSIADSEFTGNAAPSGGGGAYIEGTSATATIQRSLFVLNDAANFSGGAIVVGPSASANVINSTFSQNSAGSGGAIEADGIVAISQSTLAQNVTAYGAALQTEGSAATQQLTVKNSLLALNTGEIGNCSFGSGSTTTAAGANLSDDATCTGFSLGTMAAQLEPLADNGGPTRTYALQAASPAVDAVEDCSDANGLPVTVDQRNAVRPVAILSAAALCDIGAFELGVEVFHDGFEGAAAN